MGFPTGIKTKNLQASGLVATGACEFYGIVASPDGVNVGVCQVFDSLVDSGIIIGSYQCSATQTAIEALPHPIHCDNGIYVVISNLANVDVRYL
jgi:hypothetical protein